MEAEPATLGSLAKAVRGRVVGDPGLAVADVTHDSRQSGPGTLFVAIRGHRVDGHRFVPGAHAAGAAVCVEEGESAPAPAIVVADTRAALGPLAAGAHGRPSERLTVIGVTGTNGKTTVTHMLEAIVSADGEVPAVLGTVGSRVAGVDLPQERTTPEASDIQRLLARMLEQGVGVAAVEVSSHALALGRVAGTRFRVAAFTNLSQDHLDFHADMEDYYRAKASLFAGERADRAVVWIDDPAGRRLAGETALPVTTVGLSGDAEIGARDLEMSLSGSQFVVTRAGVEVPVSLPLAGDFNVGNALVAAACAAEIGIGWDSIAAGIAAVRRVPGRFETVENGEDGTIVVDYAHTPDGVASVIATTRRLAPGAKVIIVVGAGGDRDRSKRPRMGEAAATGDVVFITSDNPRSEDPAAIAAAVAKGAVGGRAEVMVEIDRRLAIRRAISCAGADDVVLILGKGHEQGQEFAHETVPFDDATVAREEAGRT
jgi:UDP-N-acetylmuramoyl-L-alanyl-D-glutamate--2,6-diaminopimelate ligase